MKSILKKSFQIYAQHFWKIAVLVLMIWIPISIVNTFILEPSIDISYVQDVFEKASAADGAQYSEEALVASEKYLTYMSLFLVLALIGLISQLSIIKLTESAYRGDDDLCNISVSFEKGFKFFPRAIWALVLELLLVMCGLFFFVFPGIVMLFMSVFTLVAVMVSDVKGMNAIRYSFAIVKQNFWQTLLLVLIMYSAQYMMQVAITVVSSIVDFGNIANGILEVVMTVIVNVISALQFVIYTVNVLEREKQLDPKVLAAFNKTPDTSTNHEGEQ